jgi:hypothetical protein
LRYLKLEQLYGFGQLQQQKLLKEFGQGWNVLSLFQQLMSLRYHQSQ